MFKFDYEYLSPLLPSVTCVVPSHWAIEDAPTMGNDVEYTTRYTPAINSPFVYTFVEGVAPKDGMRTISFDIKHPRDPQTARHKTVIGGPVKVYCHNSAQSVADNGSSIPLVLLNHLLGGIPGSVPAGMSWLDFDDVFGFLEAHKELHFAFDAGKDHGLIFSNLRRHLNGKPVTASFPMMFVNNLVRLGSIDRMAKALEADLVYAPSVKSGRTLVSWLFECG